MFATKPASPGPGVFAQQQHGHQFEADFRNDPGRLSALRDLARGHPYLEDCLETAYFRLHYWVSRYSLILEPVLTFHFRLLILKYETFSHDTFNKSIQATNANGS
jgi:hypothetical protein